VKTVGYTRTAISLHWLTLVLIACGFTLAVYMVDLPLSPQKLAYFSWHKSIGVTVFMLTLARLAWRLTHRAPALLAISPKPNSGAPYGPYVVENHLSASPAMSRYPCACSPDSVEAVYEVTWILPAPSSGYAPWATAYFAKAAATTSVWSWCQREVTVPSRLSTSPSNSAGAAAW